LTDLAISDLVDLARPTAVRVFVREGADAAPGDHLDVFEPRPARLVFQEVNVAEALAASDDMASTQRADTLVTLVLLPSGARTPFELQKRTEQWMASRPDERGAPYEVPYRSDRVLWRRGRALCIGTGEFFGEIRDAIAYFSFCERELGLLESRIAAQWPAVDGDLALTHSVTRRELERQPEVDARTREAHAMRMAFIRLDTALERLDRVLSAPSQRIVSEFAQQADTVDRLRLLDDGIEFAQEVYDTANDRLLEFRYFRSEYWIEIIIAVILLVEFVVVLIDVMER
jgi:hypothetical protein